MCVRRDDYQLRFWDLRKPSAPLLSQHAHSVCVCVCVCICVCVCKGLTRGLACRSRTVLSVNTTQPEFYPRESLFCRRQALRSAGTLPVTECVRAGTTTSSGSGTCASRQRRCSRSTPTRTGSPLPATTGLTRVCVCVCRNLCLCVRERA